MIREERPQDREAIRELNREAFGQPQEAELVDALRADGGVLLSLVALEDDRVVGHILYSPVAIRTSGRTITGAGLGPMAVRPERQRRGIGAQLIEAGNRTMSARGCPFVVVLGHPEYYPRFGFAQASRRGIRCEWDVPDEVFMLLVLDEAALGDIAGSARYHEAFNRFA